MVGKLRSAIALALAVTALGTGAAVAHHGWSQYDDGVELDLTGEVLEASFANPHATMRFQADGKAWRVILAPPSRMASRGLTDAVLQPGVEATVVGHPHRSDPEEMRAERVTVDGQTYEMNR